jgi:hypothetical protein
MTNIMLVLIPNQIIIIKAKIAFNINDVLIKNQINKNSYGLLWSILFFI